MNEMTMITGPEPIEVARWLSIRSALRIEIRTGLRHSRGSVKDLANDITGENHRLKRDAYKALNAKIVETIGSDFDKPLE